LKCPSCSSDRVMLRHKVLKVDGNMEYSYHCSTCLLVFKEESTEKERAREVLME